MTARRVLFIDDEPEWRDAVREILEAHGYEMIGAASGEEGLIACSRARPDVIIVDLMMEEVDSGLSFIRDLHAKGIETPVYLLSSVGDMVNRHVDAEAIGVAGVLQKPIDAATLLSLLQAHLTPAHH